MAALNIDYNEIAKRLPKKQYKFRESWYVYKSNKPALVAAFVVVFLFAVAFIGPLFFPYETALKQTIRDMLTSPNSKYWFGTDNLGRDIFARIINGARISLTLGFIPTIIGMFFGMLFGACAAYFGKLVDNIIMRVCDILTCIPGILLMLLFVTVLGYGFENLLIAITAASIPSYTRYVRSLILSIVENDYVEAARSCGTGSIAIMYKHVLRNAIGPLLLLGTSNISEMIMMGAGLSFLGLGVQPPTPEWGLMLANARDFMRSAPYMLFIPGIAILLSVLSFNLVGDGLRDVLDPRLRR